MAEIILQMPPAWWPAAARIWTLAISVERVPRWWCEITQVLMPKCQGGMRPLGVANLFWRTGMSTMIRNLGSSVDTRAGVELQGSLAGHSAATTHARIQHDAWANLDRDHVDDYGFAIIGEDLSKASDSIVPELAISFAERLGLHNGVCGVLLHVYRTAIRTFKTSHAVLPWVRVPVGLIQACPVSPMLTATTKNSSWRTVSMPEVHASFYVDDIAYWTTRKDAAVAHNLQLVAATSRALVSRIGLLNNIDNAHTAASSKSLQSALDHHARASTASRHERHQYVVFEAHGRAPRK